MRHCPCTHKQKRRHFHAKTTVHWQSTHSARHIPLCSIFQLQIVLYDLKIVWFQVWLFIISNCCWSTFMNVKLGLELNKNFKEWPSYSDCELKKNSFQKVSEFSQGKQKLRLLGQFSKFLQFFFLHGAWLCGFHICFWYHSNPTWNDWDMAKICSAGVFAPPLNRQLRTPPG